MRTPSPALLAALLLLAPGPSARAAAPADNADAAETLASARRAAGGDAWETIRTLHAVGKVEIGGLSGRLETWVDLASGRYADRFELGPASFAQGFDGSRAWSADTSGQAKIDDSADARETATNEAYRRSFAFWFPGRRTASIAGPDTRRDGERSFRSVRVSPEGGHPFGIWFDEKTSLADRIVEASGGETSTVLFSDYQAVSGARFPRGIRVTNGQPQYDQKISLETIEVNASIAASVFAVPPPPPPDFFFANGATSTTVPFEIVNEHIALDVRLNGHGPHRIYCDTGGSNVITPDLARELGVVSSGALQGTGTGEGSADVGLAKIDSIQIGDATIRRQIFAVFDFSSLATLDGSPIPGLVGYEVFKRFVVTIDYEKRKLTLTQPSAFRYAGHGTEVPLAFHGTKAQVQGSIDGIPGAFDIDTGSRASLDISRPFVEDHDLVKRYGARVETISGWGLGGPVRSLLARAGTLTLGGIEIPGVVALLSRQQTGGLADPSIAGNVGAGILRRFTLTFDYPGKRIFFEKNASFAAPDTFDRAGFWINAAPGAFEIVDIVAGGPAAEAGLRAGEKIIAIDDRPIAGSDLSAFRKRLRTDAPGTRVRLTVTASDGTTRPVAIVLRDLV